MWFFGRGKRLLSLFQEYIAERRTLRNISERSVKSSQLILAEFDAFTGAIPVDRIRQRDVERYILHLRGGVSESTIHTKIARIRAFFSFCVRRGYIQANPACVGLRKPRGRPPRWVPLQELRRALLVAARTDRERLIVEILAGTGMRIGELSALKWSDIEGDWLVIHGKGGRERRIPLSDELARSLCVPRVGEYIICSERDEGQVSPARLSKIVVSMAKHARLTRIGAHSFRRAYITALCAKTSNIAAISALVGHSDVKTTAIYMSSQPETLRSVAHLLQ